MLGLSVGINTGNGDWYSFDAHMRRIHSRDNKSTVAGETVVRSKFDLSRFVAIRHTVYERNGQSFNKYIVYFTEG